MLNCQNKNWRICSLSSWNAIVRASALALIYDLEYWTQKADKTENMLKSSIKISYSINLIKWQANSLHIKLLTNKSSRVNQAHKDKQAERGCILKVKLYSR